MSLSRIVLGLSTLLFAVFGLIGALAPGWLASKVEIVLPSPTATIDFRATYGGFLLGFAAFLAWCTMRPEMLRTGLAASALAFGGFAAVRILGIALDGRPKRMLLIVLAIEIASAALTGWLACRSR